MSPGYRSRAAELGGDPARLQEFAYDALNEASKDLGSRAPTTLAAIAQAAAVALLAVQLGRLADAIEADNAALPFPAAPQP